MNGLGLQITATRSVITANGPLTHTITAIVPVKTVNPEIVTAFATGLVTSIWEESEGFDDGDWWKNVGAN